MFVRLSAAIAAVSLLSSAALAQGAKPTAPHTPKPQNPPIKKNPGGEKKKSKKQEVKKNKK